MAPKKDDYPIINLELEASDEVLPCPFCGGTDLELCNTHTASYWIECPCGAEVRGGGFSPKRGYAQMKHHLKAKAAALAAWNRREGA